MKIKIVYKGGNSVVSDVNYTYTEKGYLYYTRNQKINPVFQKPVKIPLSDIEEVVWVLDKPEPVHDTDELPESMTQFHAVMDTLISLADVSGDLAILANKPQYQMSHELRTELESLQFSLKHFNESFYFEF